MVSLKLQTSWYAHALTRETKQSSSTME